MTYDDEDDYDDDGSVWCVCVRSPYSLQRQHCGSAKILPAFLLIATPNALLAISASNLYGCITYVTVY